ncbi:MAG: hypothetical protein O9273_03380 [Acetobacteraceae bacterium]|jgi:hypothetical protein|nr:hypothetical protein [Acetobacteraceae bacterium]
MTACRKKKALKLDELQPADWMAAIRTAIIQLEDGEAWLVKDPCNEERIEKWVNHWKVSRGGFLKLRWQAFEAEIEQLRLRIPQLPDAISIAEASERAAHNLRKMKFPPAGKKNKTTGQLHLVAFSKVALCLAPDKAVVNDSWVRTYFDVRKSSNETVAIYFEKEFEERKSKIQDVLLNYKNNGSTIPDSQHRRDSWNDLTLQRRVLDVALMMAAGRGI